MDTQNKTHRCFGCGAPIGVQRVRQFISTSKYTKKTTGRDKAGPYCGNQCRASSMSPVRDRVVIESGQS